MPTTRDQVPFPGDSNCSLSSAVQLNNRPFTRLHLLPVPEQLQPLSSRRRRELQWPPIPLNSIRGLWSPSIDLQSFTWHLQSIAIPSAFEVFVSLIRRSIKLHQERQKEREAVSVVDRVGSWRWAGLGLLFIVWKRPLICLEPSRCPLGSRTRTYRRALAWWLP